MSTWVIFGGDHYKYDAGGLYPLRLLPGRILHECAEDFTTGLKKRSNYLHGSSFLVAYLQEWVTSNDA